MTRLGRNPVVLLLLALLALGGAGCGKKDKTTNPGDPTATVSGFVQNAVGGAPVAGATVLASSGASTTSDGSGRFSLTVAANQRVRIDVTKSGFSLNQLVVQLAKNEAKSYTVGLMTAGTSASVAPAAGGTVTDAGSGAVLALPANFVTASGPVTVTVTGLDPTTDQIKALPGGLDALDAGGNPVYLQPVSFAEYTVKDAAGNVLQFNPSASAGADIELPIPASLQGQPGYEDGDPIECYVYDPADGKWKTPVPGVVGPSSVNGDPAIKATIFHLSWYGGAPASSEIACVEGTVTLNGTPLANVDVEAFPGGNTRTDANGHYQVQAAVNSEVRVVATQVSGTTFRTGEGSVQTGSSAVKCAHLDIALGGEQEGEYSVMAFLSSGWVYWGDQDGAFAILSFGPPISSVPVEGATVQVGTGSTFYTLPHVASGVYVLMSGTSGFSLAPGQIYTLRIDFTSDGSFDASGQVRMVGRPTITAPGDGATVGASFTATWTDPGTSVGGYSAAYFGEVVDAVEDTIARMFVTNQLTKAIGNGVVDPVYGFPNDPLAAGDYQIGLLAGNGPTWFVFGDSAFSYLPNVTGTNASGYFTAIASSDTVSFTSTGAAARAPLAAAAPPARRAPHAALGARAADQAPWSAFRMPASLRKALDRARGAGPRRLTAARR
jgi:hypothetical protein